LIQLARRFWETNSEAFEARNYSRVVVPGSAVKATSLGPVSSETKKEQIGESLYLKIGNLPFWWIPGPALVIGAFFIIAAISKKLSWLASVRLALRRSVSTASTPSLPFTAESEEQITATVPADAATGFISIVHAGGTASSPTAFTLLNDADGDEVRASMTPGQLRGFYRCAVVR